jgi:hypothetical protein
MADAAEQEISLISAVAAVGENNNDELTGTIWSYLKHENAFYEVTNLSEDLLLDLHCTMVPIICNHHQCRLQS